MLSQLRKSLRRQITILIVPHSGLPLWKLKFSLSFIVFCCVLWSALTLWSGYITGRYFDYWVTKADNSVLRTRMQNMADRVSMDLEYLEVTRKTDEQMRRMLGMGNRTVIIEKEALGGPTLYDHQNFRKVLSGKVSEWSEAVFQNTMLRIKEESRQRLASFQEIAWYIANQRNLYKAKPSIWPTMGNVTSPFGYRLLSINTPGEDKFHSGIDIANNPETPVYATADGVVRHSGWASGYGEAILIDHGLGYSTLYAHATELLVKEGGKVLRGQVIARMGTTGRSTGCHLHYEVWRDGVPVNPMRFIQVGSMDSVPSLSAGNYSD